MNEHRDPRRVPSHPAEALVEVELMLLELSPLFDSAVHALGDALPGLSGAASGNGSPGGGGAFVHTGKHASTSVVERSVDRGMPIEQRILDDLERLPGRIVVAVQRCARSGGWRLSTPGNLPSVKQLQWARVAVRAMLDNGIAARVTPTPAERLYARLVDLERIVGRWGAPAREPRAVRAHGLAADTTDMWCRSCLNVGMREPRSDRYPTKGLCRWCGNFESEEGFVPTIELLEARRDGRRVTVEMVAAARPGKRRKKRRGRR